MRVIEGMTQTKAQPKNTVSAFVGSSTAPSIGDTFDSAPTPTHHVQLARQVKANLSLLEESHQRMGFMLREVSGIVEKARR